MTLSSPALNDAAAWAIAGGLAGMGELELVLGFCDRVRAAGIPITRVLVLVDTLHPIHEGRVFRWQADDRGEMVEYGRTSESEERTERWRQSTFFHLEQTGRPHVRLKLQDGPVAEFPVLEELREQGYTDYLACANRFSGEGAIGEMDCIYSSWTSNAPGGFTEEALESLEQSWPVLALAVKCASLARISATLVETYLGKDAGRRVLQGRIARGVAERIRAVIWFSDLRSFTEITDTTAPEQIIPLLNDYADVVISAVHSAGGEVLKLIGDGILAVFKAPDQGEACRCALAAEAKMREDLAALSRARTSDGLPITIVSLGLHAGEVFYGNIGSVDRLDFTVIGPAVNEASRIVGLCRPLQQDVLVSASFASSAFSEDRGRLVPVGTHDLRGVAHAQELFTLLPAPPATSVGE